MTKLGMFSDLRQNISIDQFENDRLLVLDQAHVNSYFRLKHRIILQSETAYRWFSPL